MARSPKDTHVFLVGAGIASLSAAVHLIVDAAVDPAHVHIFDAAPVPGGCFSSAVQRTEKQGYIVRAARKFRGTYHCLYDTLSKVPSPERAEDDGFELLQADGEEEAAHKAGAEKDKQDSLLDYLQKHNTSVSDSGDRTVRMAVTSPHGPAAVPLDSFGLAGNHQVALMKFLMCDEAEFHGSEIQAWFEPEFFETNFWDLWSSTYVFHPWHGAVEFQRYLKRFLHDLPALKNLPGTEYTQINDVEAMVAPMAKFLVDRGVRFISNTTVEQILFAPDHNHITVNRILTRQKGHPNTVEYAVQETDIVLVTLGAVASGISVGSNSAPPTRKCSTGQLSDWGPAWTLWGQLIDACPVPGRLGNPLTFCTNTSRSSWLAFTVTTYEPTFVDRVLQFCQSSNGTCPLLTFRDCPWMLTISVPRQPYFADQGKDTRVIWGYGLFPDQDGMFSRKPMEKCTGREIFYELLGHMGMVADANADADGNVRGVLDNSVTIPIVMPLAGSPLLTKEKGDRPDVVPAGSRNLALMGQFVEMERDVAFTTEYSVRSAQKAVYEMMGLDKRPPAVYGEDPTVLVLGEFMKAMMG
ncbi:hypothetical protein TD95_004264 [Thielaviopsis punctulata]|uniref:Oleate hydratase n=1 Tax=Thielaviopsis punctulata TaxID=72032 RepID=A0A0F4Z7M7_9PEZI|nr:hypothetical protein TD95_004264 [Thielaviopsis punctulata]